MKDLKVRLTHALVLLLSLYNQYFSFLKSSCPVGKDVIWFSIYGKNYGNLKKIGIKLPYDPAMTFLAIYSPKTKT